MININEYFVSSYLTPGATRDNFIFENCPAEFLEKAKHLLSSQEGSVKSCVIEIDSQTEEMIEKTLAGFENNLHKTFISRDYICSEIMRKLLLITNSNPEALSSIESGLKSIKAGDIAESKKYHAIAPMPFDITSFSREVAKFELNFILKNTHNKFIQEAINNFISSREPFSVKIFSSQGLPSYRDQAKNLIESPHDYMKRNIQDFIEYQPEKQ